MSRFIGSRRFTRYLVPKGKTVYDLLPVDGSYLCVASNAVGVQVPSQVATFLIDCSFQSTACMHVLSEDNLSAIHHMLHSGKVVLVTSFCEIRDFRHPGAGLHREAHVYELTYLGYGEPSYVAVHREQSGYYALYSFSRHPVIMGFDLSDLFGLIEL